MQVFNLFIILLIFVLLILYWNWNWNLDLDLDFTKEKFQSECWEYGNDYNSCYSDSNCTIGFLSDGSTHCVKKFLYEDI